MVARVSPPADISVIVVLVNVAALPRGRQSGDRRTASLAEPTSHWSVRRVLGSASGSSSGATLRVPLPAGT